MHARRLAQGLFAVTVALAAGSAALLLSGTLRGLPDSRTSLLLLVPALAFATTGALIAVHHPSHSVGWLCLAIGALWSLVVGSSALAPWGVLTGALPEEALAWVAWFGWLWVPALGLMGTHLLLRLPSGRLLSPRWRPYSWWCTAVLAVASVVIAVEPYPPGVRGTTNPMALPETVPDMLVDLMGTVVTVLVPLALLGSLGSLVLRYRRTDDEERHQIRWLVFGGLVFLGTYLLAMAAVLVGGVPEDSPAFGVITGVVFISYAAVPAAIGVSVLRYRLYDIDVVISKSLVWAGLVGFITVVYVAVVVGVGWLVGAGDETNPGLSIAATAVVAVAFQPVRERLQHLANRLVYGQRATPYEVLSAFSARMGQTEETEAMLERMARLLAEGTGADPARVWLRVGDTLRPAAAWPAASGTPDQVAMSGATLPDLPGDRAVGVVSAGETLGALTITKARGEVVTPPEEKLLDDLAAQAGLMLRNVRLTAELMQRVEQLRASRQRLVAATDAERRRLERDLHDGAQQQLVALKIKLGVARTLASRESAAKTAALLEQLSGDADDAVDTLRDLARGIYPPLLAAEGLPAALTAQAAKAALPVTVTATDVGRYPQDVEAAVYFSCLEALQNTAKYADATAASITLSANRDTLVFSVTDDGTGFNPATTPRGAGLANIADRLDALNGTVTITSRPGGGTTITGSLPLPTAAPVGPDGGAQRPERGAAPHPAVDA